MFSFRVDLVQQIAYHMYLIWFPFKCLLSFFASAQSWDCHLQITWLVNWCFSCTLLSFWTLNVYTLLRLWPFFIFEKKLTCGCWIFFDIFPLWLFTATYWAFWTVAKYFGHPSFCILLVYHRAFVQAPFWLSKTFELDFPCLPLCNWVSPLVFW